MTSDARIQLAVCGEEELKTLIAGAQQRLETIKIQHEMKTTQTILSLPDLRPGQ